MIDDIESDQGAKDMKKETDLLRKLDGMLAKYAGPPCSACEVAMMRGRYPDPEHTECRKAIRARLE